ncbi:MAG: CYTH domain-containing protein [Ruminococcaceae bacterium]|nr:CYTH domain-containing protein [Oscillospiraceae bacterium]
MLEYEKKFLLQRSEYECLKNHKFCKGNAVRQINYYYDTEDFDYDYKGITCRIREKNGQFVATVKEHKTGGSDCSIERSRFVNNEADTVLFRGMGVTFQGKLVTDRIVTEPVNGVKVMLDHNIYLETEDFELEIEYEPDKEHEATEVEGILARHLGFDPKTHGIGFLWDKIGRVSNKSHRFFSHYRELKAIRR